MFRFSSTDTAGGLALAFDDADILVEVDGTVIAGGQSTAISLELASVNTATDTITIENHGLQTGDELLYLAADPDDPDNALTAIGGLESGVTYRVVVVDENTIQLVRGETISFDTDATLSVNPDSTQSVSRKAEISFEPDTALDVVENTIRFTTAHGFYTGQVVDYLVASDGGEAVGGLENESTYVVAVVDDSTIKLGTINADDENATGETFTYDGETYYVIDLTGGSATTSTISFDPSGQDAGTGASVADDEIIFADTHNFTTGQRLVYSSGGGAAIGGLVDGGVYYAIVTGTDRIQLAASQADAEAGIAISLDAQSASGTAHSFVGYHTHLLNYLETALEFDVADAVDTENGTITFDDEHGLETGDAVVYTTDSSFSTEIDLNRGTQFSLADSTVTFDPAGITGDDEAVVADDGMTIVLDVIHDFVTGQRVHYDAGQDGTAISGLSDDTDYYVIASGDDRIQLAATREDALAGIAISGLSASGSAGASHSLTAKAVDLVDDLLVITNHGFATGQQITYVVDEGGTAIGGLSNGQTLYAICVNKNILQLATSRENASAGIAIDLTSEPAGSVQGFQTATVVCLFDGSRTEASVDLETGTIEIAEHGLTTGQLVIYSANDGEVIGGLSEGEAYYVIVVDADHIRLAASSQDAAADIPVALTATGAIGLDLHMITRIDAEGDEIESIYFDPTLQAAVVDGGIWNPDHGYETGDRVTYLAGGGEAIGGLIDGHDYYVVVLDENRFGLADAQDPANDPDDPSSLVLVTLTNGAATGTRHGFERASTVTRYDAAIGGLTAGEVYYVTVVDAYTIRLCDSLLTAVAAVPVDLSLSAQQQANADTLTHTLQIPNEASGINVVAELEASNSAVVESSVGAIPSLGDILSGNVPPDPKVLKSVVKGAGSSYNTSGTAAVSVAASVGVSLLDHDVAAVVGSIASLQSLADVNIAAIAEQGTSINVQGNITTETTNKTTSGSSATTKTKAAAAAVAIAVGVYDNSVQAIVEGGAQIDAAAAVGVSADLSYPLLVDSIPFNTAGFDFSSDSVIEELGELFNGQLGMTGVFNMWVTTTGRAPDATLTITGSVGISSYTNRCEAIIEAGALVNQDETYRTADQSVQVSADTVMELINIAGVIQLNLNEQGIRNLAKSRKIGSRSSPISLFGNEAKTLGLGGSVLVQLIDNQTVARIEAADVYAGADGTITVSAQEDVFSLDYVQTGGNSGKAGVSGSFSFATQTSQTLAQIESGAVITGGILVVEAASSATHLNFTGAVQLARQLGIGVSAGVTVVERDTQALIGKILTADDTTPGTAGTVVDVDALSIQAASSGLILGIGVAGAVVSDVPGLTIKDTASSAQPPEIGAGIAGVVTVCELDDLTLTYINDSGRIDSNGGPVAIRASDTTDVQSIAGAAAFAKVSKTAVGIAGAFSYNDLDMTTEAFIAGAEVSDAGDVSLVAEAAGDVVAVAMGVAVAAAVSNTGSATPGGVAGAVSGAAAVNAISATIRSSLTQTDISSEGTITLEASDETTVTAVSIGGAAAVSQSSAVAVTGSLSLNTIDGGIETIVEGCDIGAGGEVLLASTDNTVASADAGGVAIAISAQKTGTTGATGAAAVGAAVAVNEIGEGGARTVHARIEDSIVTAGADVALAAIYGATVSAAAIAGAGAAQTGGAGGGSKLTLAGAGAGSGNAIDLDIEASISAKSEVAAGGAGDIILTASDQSQIYADAGGVALALTTGAGTGSSLTASVGMAGAVNVIERNVIAGIDDSAAIAGGDILISADSTMTVQAFALGLAVSGSSSSGSGMSGVFAGAGSGASNTVSGAVEAAIVAADASESQSVQACTGSITLAAADQSVIRADAGGVAIAVAASGGAANSASLAFGASVALNEVSVTVRALGDDSVIEAQGDVTVSALSTTQIGAVTLAGSGSVASGSGGSIGAAIAGAGAASANSIANTTEALITNGSSVNCVDGDLCLRAVDSAAISADSAGGSVAVSAGSQTSVAVAVGVSVAINEIDNTVRAAIEGSSILDVDDLGVTAAANGTVDAIAVAAAVSVASGTTTGVAVSGGGAVATNYIGTDVEGYLSGVTAANTDAVTIKAQNIAEVNADVAAISASCGVSPQSGGAAAIGVSVARNFIGWSPDEETGYDLSTDLGLAQGEILSSGQRVLIASGALAGDVYEYLGEDLVQPAADFTTAGGTQTVAYGDVILVAEDFAGSGTLGGFYQYVGDGAAIDLSAADYLGDDWEPAGIDLRVQDYSDTTVWRQVNLAESPARTRAYAENSTISASGDLSIAADAEQRIDAVVATASVAIAGGGQTGVGISAGGVFAENRISSDIDSFTSGGGISAGSITITADDSSGIFAVAGAASISGAFGGTAGVAVSVGLSMAFNEVASDVSAYIHNADVDASSGAATVAATSSGQLLFELDLEQLAFSAGDLDDAASATADDADTEDVDEGAEDQTADQEVLEALRSAFADNGEILAVTDSVTPGALYTTGAGVVDLAQGDTVRTAGGYENGGLEGRVYRFAASDETGVDLGAEDYSASSRWELVTAELTLTTLVEGESWVLVDGSGAAYILRKSEETVSVTRSTINAICAAASLAASFGGTTGVSVSGAGAFSANAILGSTRAYVDDSSVTGAGDVTVCATGSAGITSLVASASAALGGGGTVGVGVSLGASVAWNFIGFELDGTESGAEISAYACDSIIDAGGRLAVTALSDQTVSATVFAGSAAVTGGGAVGVGASGSGVWSENRTAENVLAGIERSSSITAADITLRAEDSSRIMADAGAVSLAAAFSGTAAVSVSIGVSLARNVIDNTVQASADGVLPLEAESGAIAIEAHESAAIASRAAAASLSGAGSWVGLSFSGAGASAVNTILTDTLAFAAESHLQSAGDVTLLAANDSEIQSLIATASAAVSGGLVGAGASIGASVAKNHIGFDEDGNAVEDSARVHAFLRDSSLYSASGDFTICADAVETIDATVLAGSVALAGGGVGIAASGSGVSAENRIAADVAAYIEGDRAGAGGGISAASITLYASDSPGITSLAGAASLAGAFGGGSYTLAVGVALAKNEVLDEVEAFIRDNDDGVSAFSGDIVISALVSGRFLFNLPAGINAATMDAQAGLDTLSGAFLTALIDAFAGNGISLAGEIRLDAVADGSGWTVGCGEENYTVRLTRRRACRVRPHHLCRYSRRFAFRSHRRRLFRFRCGRRGHQSRLYPDQCLHRGERHLPGLGCNAFRRRHLGDFGHGPYRVGGFLHGILRRDRGIPGHLPGPQFHRVVAPGGFL